MMSWFGKKKRDEKFLVDMMRAAAEGEGTARLKSSLATLGVDVSESRKPAQIAGYGALALLKEASERSNFSASTEDTDFIDGVMLMVFSNHMSYVLQCSFEVTAQFVLAIHFGVEKTSQMQEAIASYNKMSHGNSSFIRAVGNSCIKWCNVSSEQNLNSLGELRNMLLESASKQT